MLLFPHGKRSLTYPLAVGTYGVELDPDTLTVGEARHYQSAVLDGVNAKDAACTQIISEFTEAGATFDAAGSQRPVMRHTNDGRKFYQYDGVDDGMECSNREALDGLNGWSLWMSLAIRTKAFAGLFGKLYFAAGDGSDHCHFYISGGGGNIVAQRDDRTPFTTETIDGGSNNADTILHMCFTGSTSGATLYRNGTSVGTLGSFNSNIMTDANDNVTSDGHFCIGKRHLTAPSVVEDSFAHIDVYAAFFVNSEMTSTQVQQVTNFFSTRYGLGGSAAPDAS